MAAAAAVLRPCSLGRSCAWQSTVAAPGEGCINEPKLLSCPHYREENKVDFERSRYCEIVWDSEI